MEIKFVVNGEPKGKARPRFAAGRAYTPKTTVESQNNVLASYLEQCDFKFPDDAKIMVIVIAYFAVPKNDSKKTRDEKIKGLKRPTKKPDIDNILKLVLDALNGAAYRDDSQIVECMVRKYYAETPKMFVFLRSI